MKPFSHHLLIDGYNAIYQQPKLKQKLKMELGSARMQLADSVRILHDFEQWRVTLVFDGKGDKIQIERPGKEFTFSLLFSPTHLSADGVIEQLITQSKNPKTLRVATGDNMIATVGRAAGAEVISLEQLWDWVAWCEEVQRRQLTRNREAGISQWKKWQEPDFFEKA